MPALPAVPKTVRFDYHFQDSDGPVALNRWFFNYSGSLSVGDANLWVAGASASWSVSGSMQAAIVSNWSLSKVVLTDLSSVVAPQATDATVRTGTASGQSITAGVAAVVSFKIARRYRGGHPRMYITGFPTTDLANSDTWASGFPAALRSSVLTWASNIISAAPGTVGTVTHVNISYFQGFTNKTFPSGRIRPVPTPRVTPGQDIVTDVAVNPRPASQRRRNRQSQ